MSTIYLDISVSFFGSSHVSVKLQEARSSSDIYFRLRTRRADSMLFLAAGRTDYCLLVLDAGRLKVTLHLFYLPKVIQETKNDGKIVNLVARPE